MIIKIKCELILILLIHNNVHVNHVVADPLYISSTEGVGL